MEFKYTPFYSLDDWEDNDTITETAHLRKRKGRVGVDEDKLLPF